MVNVFRRDVLKTAALGAFGIDAILSGISMNQSGDSITMIDLTVLYLRVEVEFGNGTRARGFSASTLSVTSWVIRSRMGFPSAPS